LYGVLLSKPFDASKMLIRQDGFIQFHTLNEFFYLRPKRAVNSS